jgi:hypothetical protein
VRPNARGDQRREHPVAVSRTRAVPRDLVGARQSVHSAKGSEQGIRRGTSRNPQRVWDCLALPWPGAPRGPGRCIPSSARRGQGPAVRWNAGGRQGFTGKCIAPTMCAPSRGTMCGKGGTDDVRSDARESSIHSPAWL